MPDFDPYHKWLGIPPEEQPPNHYRLLGIALFESDLDVIAIAADRQMGHVRSFQLGKDSDASQKLLNELAAAKICLLNPKKKAEYDERLGNLLCPDLEVVEETAEWYVQTPDGEEFGPVAKVELNGWAAEGRLDANCRLRSKGSDQWESAAVVYPALAGRGAATVLPRAKEAEEADYDDEPRKQAAPIPVALPLLVAAPPVAAPLPVVAPPADLGESLTRRKPIHVQPTHSAPRGAYPLWMVSGGVGVAVFLLGVILAGLSGRGGKDDVAFPVPTPAKPPPVVKRQPKPPSTPSGEEKAAPPIPSPAKAGPDAEPGITVSVTPSELPPLQIKPEPKPEQKPPGTPAKEKPRDRFAVPDDQAQEAARKTAEEVYGSRAQQAKTAAEKTALAKAILEAALRVRDGSTDQYVLLETACDVAAGAGDAETALAAVDQLARRFDVPRLKLRADALAVAVRRASTAAQQMAVTEAAVAVIDELAAADECETAISLCDAVRSAAQKARQYRLVNDLAARARKLKLQEAAAREYRAAMAVMEKSPTDPAANLAAGKYLCFVKGDWGRGLAMLARGADPALMDAAVKDVKGATSAEGQAAVGDAWWTLAEARQGAERESLMLRAGSWYRRAQPNLAAGLVRVRIDNRLEEIATIGRDKPETPTVLRPAIAPFDENQAQQYQAVWAKHLKVPVVHTNSIGMKLVLIPPGEFQMGSTPEEVAKLRQNAPEWYRERVSSESPKHRVQITKPFYLGVYEVTQQEYERVTGSNPSEFPRNPDRPVEKVLWREVVEFCRRLSDIPHEKAARALYRLPTEAEWEYACRAGTTTPYTFGDDISRLGDYAWWAGNSQGQSHPVGQLKPNAWGLYDMHGNVYEWCADWHAEDYYARSPVNDPVGPDSGAYRVLRGGSWHDDNPALFRSAYHHFSSPNARLITRRGFRVVRILAP